ncbi:MAG TPA: hypothetical protein VE967_10970 [Gemmatimonadaceae bacterium]|nr:hypothetical protein [Gemmatimonadaceae bacterium]
MGRIPGELIPIVAIIAGAAIAIFVPLVRAYAKRLEREGSAPLQSPELDARLDRIEHAIESIAIEIERVSEGQRFTTRLLSEQKAPRALGGDAEGRP